MARNEFSRKRAPNQKDRYLNDREAAEPRSNYNRSGNRRVAPDWDQW